MAHWPLESLGSSQSALFIAINLTQIKHMKHLALALIFLFVTACESGVDRLETLATQLPLPATSRTEHLPLPIGIPAGRTELHR